MGRTLKAIIYIMFKTLKISIRYKIIKLILKSVNKCSKTVTYVCVINLLFVQSAKSVQLSVTLLKLLSSTFLCNC